MLGIMLAPVTPFAMEKLWNWLGMETDLWQGGWTEGLREVPAGRQLGKPEILFPRLDDELIQPEIERLQKMLED
jgi:methionyl-tRNA synthetase